MKFLIDYALPPRLATLLKAAGYDATHIRNQGLQAAPDSLVLERAQEEDRILISADSDFAALLALRETNTPSFILFKEPGLISAEDYAAKLIPMLPGLKRELARRCVAVFRGGRIGVRNLPIRPS